MSPPAAQPARRAAARFSLRLRDLGAPVREAFAAMQIEADHAAAEIERLRERLLAAEALADHDVLVPVLNRRAFLAAVQRSTAFAARYGGEGALLFLDMDGLKRLNDEFGHAAGDAALRHLGRVLRASVRETDTIGRLGGDEFGIILEQVGREEARQKMAFLGEAIANSPLHHEGVEHALSASIGLHVLQATESSEDALARADEEMYAAKRRRRMARVAATQ